MLRQLLSITGSITARRTYPKALYHALNLSSAPAAALEAAVEETAAPSRPPAAAAAAQPPATPTLRWSDHLKEVAAAGDLRTTMQVLEARVQAGHTLSTRRAFETAIRLLPPRLALQAYHLAREKGVEPTTSMAISVVRVYAALGMLRHIEGAVKEMVAAGLTPHWSVYFNW